MEDLVVGLAKSVVQGALTKVQSAIEEDEKLRQRAQINLAFMTVEFEMMQSFLDVANKENVKNKLVATWVRHVRKVAYDVQDCIELVIHLDDGPSWWRRLLPGCWRGPLPLDVAVAEIEQLKARVEDVSKCYTRYNLINDSGSKLVMMQQPASRATAGDMLVEARQTTKRQLRFGDLTQLIAKADKDLQVISVWGVGGDHGTTSIIRKAYNDPEICQKFPCRSWVKLMRPFNPDKFVRCFMAQYYANSCQGQEGSIGVHVRMKMKVSQDELFDEFMKQLDKRYLIVLENLSNMVDWDAIRTFLPHKTDGGSRIIVSTQQPEVASLCVGHSYKLLELKKFSDEHSVCAFFEQDSHHDDDHNDPGNKGKDKQLSSEHKLSRQGATLHTQWSTSGISSPHKLNTDSEISLIARGSELKELRKYTAIVRINSSQVTAVWGMPGVGKSAIARNLYDDKMRNSDQFIKYGWVDISHPFNLRDFSASLLLGFHSDSLRAKDAYRVTMGIKDPIQECRNFLSKYACFVVLNNLQTTEEWDLIEDSLVSRPSTSVILVLTNEAGTAAHCAGSKEDFLNVKGLEADAAFALFKKEVQRESRLESLPLKDDHPGLRELILRCGGLPIVIASIARSLAKEMNEIKWKDIIATMNEGFMKELETKPQFHNLRGLFGWMHSYIGNCLDYLKPCILYMSIFPPEETIRRRRLVRRWISEGYSKESSRKSLEEHGEELFYSLVNMSIIQQPPQSAAAAASSDARMVKCQVNRFLYEYIISRQKEENLVFQLGKDRSISTQCTWHHLTIWKRWNRDQIVFESINLSRLRSLTVFGDWKPFFISKTMKLLRVLDLENASGVQDQDLEQMVKLLRRLKFLSLRGCTGICNLPSSLGGLRQLQSLDIRHTSIVTLPAKITRLKKLQYIRAGTRVQAETASAPCLPTSQFPGMRGCGRLVGVKVPRGLGKMKALHTLGVINVSASRSKGILKQLQKLTQLHKLGVSGINRRNSRKFFSAISGHGHLESLSVRLKKGNKRCLDDVSLPWEKLESLKLYGFGNKLPLSRRLPEDELPCSPEDELAVSTFGPRFLQALQSLSALPQDEEPVPGPLLHQVASNQVKKLTKLVLEMDELTDEDMKFLAELPHLCILRLRVKQPTLCFEAKMFGLELSTFTKVKILEISCSSSSHVTFGSETMKQLVVLRLDFSSGSPSYRLSGLNHLPELKEVLLKGTNNDETFKSAVQEELANHPNKPVVRLEEQPRSS